MSTMKVDRLTPPLVEGDRLLRDEFLRRWEGMPDLKRAELIGGVVHMPSPMSLDHGEFGPSLSFWLKSYEMQTLGCKVGAETTTFLLDDSPQPDLYLRILPEYGGKAKPSGKYLQGPSELIVEISVSSEAYDLGEKRDLYQEAGVQEYLCVLKAEREIHWVTLEKHGYQAMTPTSQKVWQSKVFPGLWLDEEALWDQNDAKLLETLNLGLKSPEHILFAQKLLTRKK